MALANREMDLDYNDGRIERVIAMYEGFMLTEMKNPEPEIGVTRFVMYTPQYILDAIGLICTNIPEESIVDSLHETFVEAVKRELEYHN